MNNCCYILGVKHILKQYSWLQNRGGRFLKVPVQQMVRLLHGQVWPPSPLQEDMFNYCGQMDDIQQISMAFCESDAIFICGSQ